jgi:16S rRNA (cytosine967-C5)-methyltransferase
VALAALTRIEQDGAYANLVVPRLVADVPVRDRGLATELVYGSTRMRRALDFAVDRFLMRDPPPELRTLLRLGAYQLLCLRVPAHAAVGETVALAPPRLRGVTNAVLRRIATAGEPVWPDVATRLSYPDWIVARLVSELGEPDALDALTRMNVAPPVSVRADGYVQDRSSQWVGELVDAQPGERVVDLCAAPGGKATAMAASGAFVVAADRQFARAGLVVANVDRLGCGDRLAVLVADAAAPPLRAGSADRVLLDAPCSGLGALRRRPDARWRISEADVTELAVLQARLLAAARTLVRPGGLLVYSVCTLTAAESTELDDGGWDVPTRPGAPWRPIGRGMRVLPQDADTDGMTVLRWRRPVSG